MKATKGKDIRGDCGDVAKEFRDMLNKLVEEEITKAAASSRIWFSKEQGCANVAFDEEAWNKAALESLGLADKVIIPIPKPGDRVSFPVACVTGVCFKTEPDNDIYRWSQKRNCLEAWYNNTWHSAAVSVEWFTEVTVVEEPKVPEPVWKDCNFIEAVEWMKKKPTENKACWNGSLFHVDADIVFDESNTTLMSRENEIEPVLGKWQIPVQ